MNNGTLRVAGTGRLSVPPDTAEITVTLTACEKEYGKAVGLVDEKAERLRAAVSGAGFDDGTLSTVSWSVNPRNEGYHDKDGTYRERFAGYDVRHVIKLTVPSDGRSTGLAVDAAAGCGADPGLSVCFTVKDPDSLADELLKRAAEDGKRRAETLATATGVSLGRVIDVNCGGGEPGIYSPSRFSDEAANDGAVMMRKAAFGAALSVAPQNIENEIRVIFTWEITTSERNL